MNILLEFCIATIIAMFGYYYFLILIQLLGIIKIVDSKDKFNWKYAIPFYQFFKVFKNEK